MLCSVTPPADQPPECGVRIDDRKWENSASAKSRTRLDHARSAPRNSARGDTLHLLRTDRLACGGQCGPRARAQFAMCMDESRHHRGTALFTLRCEPAGTRRGAGPVAVVRKTYAGMRYVGCTAVSHSRLNAFRITMYGQKPRAQYTWRVHVFPGLKQQRQKIHSASSGPGLHG